MNQYQEIETTEEKEFQVVNYVSYFKDSFEQGIPFPQEIKAFLEIFNDYDMEEDIENRGRESISEELSKIDKLITSPELITTFKEGISLAQSIYPEVKLEPFPIYLIAAGKKTNARAYGGGIVLNLSNLVYKSLKYEESIELIKSMTAHESVHRFVRQLGLKPKEKLEIDEGILHTIWEEGLTTTIETIHHSWHDTFVKDFDFWSQSIRDWMKAKGDEQTRSKILYECYQRPSFRESLDKEGKKYAKLSSDTRSNEEKFRDLLAFSNGPAYHVGFVLWKRELEKGSNITELLLKGDSSVRDWLEIDN